MNYAAKKRYTRIDAWRGYAVPLHAVVGCSDTGTADDSPCRTENAQSEIKRYRREVLRPLGIKSRQRYGTSSNVFCMKRWVTVPAGDFPRAAAATVAWLEEHNRSLDLLHDANLSQCEVAA